ncbi:EAL domain-containing protein [Sphingomonas sp. PL-96]|uniref:putative bifunctional diguanylate cyclase/phosphodiesterase n=1 Tax=Sphingomonas sp. PL-96 TaxID=2887201 RepID=UPI001E3DE8BF|nr:EAL domain-containing protein [Sphingomonas sp. PL-96]MCC2977968.1 EAL domain-containing protein [Sphingomonas sp. PL-96]
MNPVAALLTADRDAERSAAIDDYDIGNSIPEADFDHIVDLAKKLFGASAAMISIVKSDVLHFKARAGLDVCTLDPRIAFCAHALDRSTPLVIEDTWRDVRFRNNPLVLGAPHVRFYAGAPLKVASGQVLGTLCIIDTEPRSFSAYDCELLQGLGQIVVDRIEVRRQKRQLARQAYYDELTGLANRMQLHQHARDHLAADTPLAVLLFDLDGFKDVNDVFGHATGDSLLRAIGERLTGLLEPDQLLARLGGDEFVVLAPGVTDPRAAWAVADRLGSGFDSGYQVDGQELRLDTCIGVALSPYHGDTIEKLVCHADLALYRAKEKGGGAIAFYEPHLRREVENRQQLQHELRRAFDRGEFELFYQPQVRLSDESIVGVEALLRWHHPKLGLLTPGHFLPVLDMMPLATSVGQWALDTAFAQAARWAACGRPLRVGINLFGSQFRSSSLPEQVAALIARHGVRPELIELELTENLAVRNIRGVAETLKGLRKLGVGIALDDFGTGYASMNVLKEFPITRLKVDKGFVAEIAATADKSAVVDSILALGRAFQLPVIAEGIEAAVQAHWLDAKGCDEGQGWLYGKPMPAAELERLRHLDELPLLECA